MTKLFTEKSEGERGDASNEDGARPPVSGVSLLTGGADKPYAFGMARALTSKGVSVDFVGSQNVDCPELHSISNLRFLNFQSDQREDAPVACKAIRLAILYGRLLRYAAVAKPRIFHILWNNKLQIVDRTLLMMYYKLWGRKIAFTAHNVNAGERDQNDSLINRLTLKVQYRLADHVFVHTRQMKADLIKDFGVPDRAVTVVPFGVNNCAPRTDLTPRDAKERLGIEKSDRTILFFGNIAPYKGLLFLVEAFQQLLSEDRSYRLIIAGRPMGGCEDYVAMVRRTIESAGLASRITQRIEFIPDEETELYFKAADVLALPYVRVFQSGVLFLAHSFGLPVVATDVGSFRDDIIDGRTGFLSRSHSPIELAGAFRRYFESPLFEHLDSRRQEIQRYCEAEHSWDVVGEKVLEVFAELGAGSTPAAASKHVRKR